MTVEELRVEAADIWQNLSNLLRLWRRGELTDVEVVGLYILIFQRYRQKRLWLGPRQLNPLGAGMASGLRLVDVPKDIVDWNLKEFSRFPTNLTLIELYSHYPMKSIPLSVNRALINWSCNQYPLELTEQIPGSLDVLKLQCQGRRCVTMLTKRAQLGGYIKDNLEACGFLLHDLIHADHYWNHPQLARGQLGFYKSVYGSLSKNVFHQWKNDSQFQHDLDYVISDMNAYCVHLVKYLKAVCLKAFLRELNKHEHARLSDKERANFNGAMTELARSWEMPLNETTIFMKLNTDATINDNEIVQLQFFFEARAEVQILAT